MLCVVFGSIVAVLHNIVFPTGGFIKHNRKKYEFLVFKGSDLTQTSFLRAVVSE